MEDSLPNNVEQCLPTLAHTNILPQRETPCSNSGDLKINDVEYWVASTLQKPSVGDGPMAQTVQKLSMAPFQLPAQRQTFTICEQCLGNSLSYNGGQLNVKSCAACRNVKKSCSFLPRKYACQHCENVFMRPEDLKGHNTKSHKGLILKAPTPSTKNSKSVRGLGREVQQLAASNASRPAKRPRNDSGISAMHINTSASQFFSPLKPQIQPHPVVPRFQIDLTCEASSAGEQEMPPTDELYQPDFPAYRPSHEPLDEIPDSPPSKPHQGSQPELHTQSQESLLQIVPSSQSRAASERARLSSETSALALQSHPPIQESETSLSELQTSHLNSKSDIYIQFQDRVMEDNYVERSLGTIRKEIKDYEGFIRCTNPRHTSAEAESQFNFLKTTQPFAVMEEIQDEKHDFFASQVSRLIVLWRSMLDVHPTAPLRDELIRFDLEGLELPEVICGTLAYVLLRTIFDEPDRLRAAERIARFRSVEELHGERFAAESIKHDQLFIHKDKSVDRELRKVARELTERHFYDLLRPLTHWDLANPTTLMKGDHIRMLSDIALKSLRLSRELQARTTEEYSYFLPHPGELFNHNDHIEVENGQAGSQKAISKSGRIIRWTLMFGIKVSRKAHNFIYAKAVVMIMDA